MHGFQCFFVSLLDYLWQPFIYQSDRIDSEVRDGIFSAFSFRFHESSVTFENKIWYCIWLHLKVVFFFFKLLKWWCFKLIKCIKIFMQTNHVFGRGEIQDLIIECILLLHQNWLEFSCLLIDKVCFHHSTILLATFIGNSESRKVWNQALELNH